MTAVYSSTRATPRRRQSRQGVLHGIEDEYRPQAGARLRARAADPRAHRWGRLRQYDGTPGDGAVGHTHLSGSGHIILTPHSTERRGDRATRLSADRRGALLGALSVGAGPDREKSRDACRTDLR